MRILRILLTLLFLNAIAANAWEYNGRHGWPEQKAPSRIITCELGESMAEAMLVESLSGLAAQAVNEGHFDTMVWIDVQDQAYQDILANTLATLGIARADKMNTWEIVKFLKNKGVVKGYIRYTADKQHANPYASNPGTNYSSNVANVYAALLKGVLIDDSLVALAKKAGLKELKDARQETPAECFAKNKHKLNRHSALSVPPSVHNLRDYAIAHSLMLYADQKDIIDPILAWVEPLSPILGWGCGDEYDFTSVIARWGHYNTATNWCMNLPLISAVSEQVTLNRTHEISPAEINFEDASSVHAFVMSDGDNMQWAMSNYLTSPHYIGNEGRKEIGLSYTLCPTSLSIISPFTWNAMVDAQSRNYSYLEYGGGYQYPDIFAANRPNRTELLREFARRINYHLQKLDVKIFGFICFNVASPEAQEAFQIYAEEMPDITGMLAVQYFPYELEGKIYWKTNKQGIDIPVVTSRYSLWNEVNEYRPRCGVPEFVASMINRDEIAAQEKKDNMLSWTIVHAWSDFAKTSKITKLPAIGFNPVKATEDLLLNTIKTVSANELLWRIRMKYRPEQTHKLIGK